MVAASKMRRAQERALKGKPYAAKITEMVSRLAGGLRVEEHPLLRSNKGEKVLVVLISTNKGLCGGLNTELFRSLTKLPSDEQIDYLTVGKKGANFITRTGKSLVADFSQKEPFVEHIPAITSFIIEEFLVFRYKRVYLSYNSFISALKHKPVKEQLLPLRPLDLSESSATLPSGDVLLEPNRRELLAALLPYFIEVKIRAAILEAEAAEHSARMLAMKNATDNAQEFIGELSLEYNKARQQAITSEIADIVTAREAVESKVSYG